VGQDGIHTKEAIVVDPGEVRSFNRCSVPEFPNRLLTRAGQ
jgi:hypothetical protein